MDRMHLIAVHQHKIPRCKYIFFLIQEKLKLPLSHGKYLDRTVPVLLPDVFSAAALKEKQLKRKSPVRNDHFMLINNIIHSTSVSFNKISLPRSKLKPPVFTSHPHKIYCMFFILLKV